ncbi:hypothetical protein EG328_008771 [Venturia inaequalis]|uniref:Uncharacterized protein n=1 Tax=Venturia inaequalis TaxID=5025 RepID=A0A8H3YMW1_VENIN|nr:hypothetical protein EG328_008771 [Venturia inaequalis]
MSNSSDEQRTQTRSSSIRMTNLYKATMNRMFTRKKAKAVKAEPKPELDLSIALPASENFRTSLLMPNLSARFSMLRELDDPSTKIGKAADDSVLAPNRQSRLNDFQSPYGLDDIAEVASIRSSIRPPFAQQNGRATSYASDGGYNTDDDSSHNGSVMSRARPGEGNTLFGGRQKVYKIAGDGLKGRTLYEDDIGVTSFQKYRQGEREREEAERLQELKDIRNGGKGEPYASPVKGPSSLNGSLTRHTSSSTTASAMDSRASTAATSINSQGTPSIPSAPTSALPSNSSQATAAAPAPALERSVTKRRLYEQGLDRDIQDQQSQQITRLNSIAKGKGALAGNGRSTPDLFNSRPLQDRPHRPGMNTFQSNSPTPSDTTSPLLNGNSFSTGRNGINANGNNGIHGLAITSSHPASEQSSPVLPPHGEPSALASAINPNDRGKATAMGVFNKPQQFSEQQFLERTKTLRKEREVPLRTHSEGLGGSPKEAQETDGDQMREVRGFTPGPFSASNRSRSTSRGPANRSRSGSTVQKYEPVASAPLPPPVPAEYAGVSAFQRAAMQMKAMNAEASPVTEAAPVEEQLPVQAPLQNRFAFHDDSESDYEQDQSMPSPKPAHPVRLPQIPALPNVQAAIPLVTQHPALREYSDLPEHPAFRSPKLPEIDFPNDATPGATNSEFDFGQPKLNNDYDTESPILGPTSGGLSGMVRQHLRQGSDTSHYSVAQPPAPEVFPSGLQTRNLTNESKSYANNTHAQSGYSHSNAWDLQDYEDYGIDNNSPISPLESTANMSQRDGDRPSHDHNDIRRQLLARTAEPSREIPWQEELRKKSHNRGNSSETQAEKEAFTSEVAARQRAIKEQLKASAESESRSSSPGPGKAGPFGGLGTLRMKTSREPSQVRDTNGKLAKFPGLNGSSTTLNSYTPSPPTSAMSDRPSYDRWRSDRSDRSEQPPRPDLRQRSRSRADTSHSREPMQPFPSYSNGMGTTTSSQSRTGSGRESEERMRSRAESNVNSTRSRSNSEHSASGRSRSRSGRYRDDLAEAMAVGNSSRTTMFPEATPAIPEQYATDFPAQPPVPEHPIPAIPHSLKEGNTLRLQTAITREREHRPLERKMSRENDSRQVDPHVFEQKGLWPPPANAMGVPSPRPSPGYSPVNPGYAHALPQGLSPRPSPGLGSISPALMANSRGSPFAGNPTPPVSATSTPIAPSFPGAGNNPNVLSSSTFGRKPTHRKMSIKKTEISEPRLISTTSVIDTVDLPAGASLMNGMHSVPAVPALNPRRKRFGFGRGDLEAPEPPFVSTQYNSLSADERERQPRSKHRIRKSSSDGAKIGLHIRAQQQGMASMQSIPTLPHKMSPPRPGKAVEGGMF